MVTELIELNETHAPTSFAECLKVFEHAKSGGNSGTILRSWLRGFISEMASSEKGSKKGRVVRAVIEAGCHAANALVYPSYSGLQPEGAAKRIRGVYTDANLS